MAEKIKVSTSIDLHNTASFSEPINTNTVLKPEHEEMAKQGMAALLCGLVQGGLNIEKAIKFRDDLKLPDEVVKEVAAQSIIYWLSHNDFVNAILIKDKFLITEQILCSFEIREAAKKTINTLLYRYNFDGVLSVMDNFLLSGQVVFDDIKSAFSHYLLNGGVDVALRVLNMFNIPKLVGTELAVKGMSQCLSFGNFKAAIEIREEFSLSKEQIQQALKDGLIESLEEGFIDTSYKLMDEFSFKPSNSEIIQESTKIADLIGNINKISPEFGEQIKKSQDILFSLFKFWDTPEQLLEMLEQYQFIIEAVSRNPRMGSKLMVKFGELDQISQENISRLFLVKDKILKLDPEIDTESLEFRQLMQEDLKDYKNNPEVLRSIEAGGIDVEQWLNYAETSYFQLESGAGLSFSETVATPLGRIRETIDSYSNRIKEVLSQYKTELVGARVSLDDPKEIEEKILLMQAELVRAKLEGSDKKVFGIQKGIDNLKAKFDNPKTASLWDKLLGDIQAFQGLKNDVFSAQEKLVEVERQFEEKASAKTPSGKEIQELKQKITKLKEELKGKFVILENRMENFQNNLTGLLAGSLGKDRSDSLVQEIRTGLEEQFNHYSTDRSTLANLFSEKTDREKEKMEGQPMSIFVWARNPDIDLYQANYSPCCISIESGCASNNTESAIADYNTDLGIQIVNIWDETKGEPVTAAWCWLGEDKEGNSVLVVDNIESNPMYSINYPKQLTKELFAFLEKYAKSIGASKLVLGKDNNDLPTAGEMVKMIDDTESYKKIGGYHREDGYYLEAVDDSVKIIWEKNAELEIKKIEIKQNVVKFEKVQTSNLSEYDFENILMMEEKIYPEDLIQGETLIQEIRNNNGLEYSSLVFGVPDGETKEQPIGYLIAVEDETDEGEPAVYLDDIAVLPEAQGQGVAWKMLQDLVKKLQTKAKSENKPILLDMHLREASQGLFEKHQDDLEAMGVKLREESFVSDYYDGEDALYKVYEVVI